MNGINAYEVSRLNLSKHTVDAAWHPTQNENEGRLGTLEEKFLLPKTLTADEDGAARKAHINPLLISDIAKAADELRAAMHGESASQHR